MTDEPIDFLAKRWKDGTEHPGAYTPREALLAAVRRIDSGEITPEHVVVCMGHYEGDGVFKHHYTQAGSFGAFGAIGLLTVIARRLGQSED